jgi:hypothetical protein
MKNVENEHSLAKGALGVALLEKNGRGAINKANAKIKDRRYTIHRDTDIRGSPSVGYAHQRNCQELAFYYPAK